MSAAFCRARSSSSSIRFAASAPRYLQRASGSTASSRALTTFLQRPQSWQSTIAVVVGNDTWTRIQKANRIAVTGSSSGASRQKSAMPALSSINDDEPEEPISSQTPFLLADIGEGISEVELLQWFVNTGDTVSQFDRICEVQSDKAAVEITSRFDGKIENLCGEVGDVMLVGKPLLYIATTGGNSAGMAAAAAAAVEQQQSEGMTQTMTLNNVDDEKDRLTIPSVGANYASYYEEKSTDENSNVGRRASSSTKVLTSPAVRKLGKENNIDLSTVLGTGPGGRILKADILKIINPSNIRDLTPSSSVGSTEEKISPAGRARARLVSSSQPMEDTTIPIRGYNRLMVKSMTSSLQVPHMVYADEINVNALTEVRDALRPLAKEMGVSKLTYMPFFIKAASLALSKYPVLNSTIDVEEMTLTHHGEHNIGVAVDTERGLAVPVVQGCQDRSVLEIAEELSRLYSLVSLERESVYV